MNQIADSSPSVPSLRINSIARKSNDGATLYVVFGWVMVGICGVFGVTGVIGLIKGDVYAAIGGLVVTTLFAGFAWDFLQKGWGRRF